MKNPYFETFVKSEEETKETTLRAFKKEFELYERSFNLCSETFNYICDLKPIDSTAKRSIALIIPRIMQSMQSIRLLLMDGYYYDAMVLERSFIESLGLCAYFALNEEEAKQWFAGEKVNVTTIKLFDYVPKLLNESTHRTYAKRAYGQTCDYVHSNIRAVASLIASMWIERQTRKTGKFVGVFKLHSAPEFDKKKMRTISLYPTLVTLVLAEIFKSELGKRRRKIDRFFKLQAKIEGMDA